MTIFPYNIKKLYENNWLGVQLVYGSEAIEVRDAEGVLQCTIEPNQAYPVSYLSWPHQVGIFDIDESNSMVFEFDNDLFEFLDIHSEILN